MRHKNAGRKFGRNTSHRRAMFRNLTANLILHERIETTDAKAKELRRVAERLITKARRLGDVGFTKHDELTVAQKARRLAVKRLIGAYIPHFVVKIEKGGVETKVDLVEKVLVTLSKRFAKRPGGYTRIVKLGPRRGDNAPMVIIEFVGDMDEASGEEPKKKARVGKASKATGATAAAPTEGAKVE
jgi:large subunit ribosomal protein L17